MGFAVVGDVAVAAVCAFVGVVEAAGAVERECVIDGCVEADGESVVLIVAACCDVVGRGGVMMTLVLSPSFAPLGTKPRLL